MLTRKCCLSIEKLCCKNRILASDNKKIIWFKKYVLSCEWGIIFSLVIIRWPFYSSVEIKQLFIALYAYKWYNASYNVRLIDYSTYLYSRNRSIESTWPSTPPRPTTRRVEVFGGPPGRWGKLWCPNRSAGKLRLLSMPSSAPRMTQICRKVSQCTVWWLRHRTTSARWPTPTTGPLLLWKLAWNNIMISLQYCHGFLRRTLNESIVLSSRGLRFLVGRKRVVFGLQFRVLIECRSYVEVVSLKPSALR